MRQDSEKSVSRTAEESLISPESVVEPSAGERPMSVGRAPGEPKGKCGFALPKARKETKFYKARAARIVTFELNQSLIECEKIDVWRLLGDLAKIDLHPLATAPAFLAPFVACAVNDNSAHGLGRGGEEMTAAVPILNLPCIHQANVRIMDECGGLERLAWFFVRQLSRRQLAQLIVHKWQKLLGRERITLLDRQQDRSHIIVHGCPIGFQVPRTRPPALVNDTN